MICTQGSFLWSWDVVVFFILFFMYIYNSFEVFDLKIVFPVKGPIIYRLNFSCPGEAGLQEEVPRYTPWQVGSVGPVLGFLV